MELLAAGGSGAGLKGGAALVVLLGFALLTVAVLWLGYGRKR